MKNFPVVSSLRPHEPSLVPSPISKKDARHLPQFDHLSTLRLGIAIRRGNGAEPKYLPRISGLPFMHVHEPLFQVDQNAPPKPNECLELSPESVIMGPRSQLLHPRGTASLS
jgi:hypothetical protein